LGAIIAAAAWRIATGDHVAVTTDRYALQKDSNVVTTDYARR
jgi:hypothetical protein